MGISEKLSLWNVLTLGKPVVFSKTYNFCKNNQYSKEVTTALTCHWHDIDATCAPVKPVGVDSGTAWPRLSFVFEPEHLNTALDHDANFAGIRDEVKPA
jgi:hypothetical protein